MMKKINFSCYYCKEKSTHNCYISWNSHVSGSRYFHHYDGADPNKILECPNCGYISTNLNYSREKVTNEFISQINKEVEERYSDMIDSYARSILKAYLYEKYLNGSESSNAIYYLSKLICYTKKYEYGKIFPEILKQYKNLTIYELDLLRTVGEFKFVSDQLSRLIPSNEEMNIAIKIEKEMCRKNLINNILNYKFGLVNSVKELKEENNKVCPNCNSKCTICDGDYFTICHQCEKSICRIPIIEI